jgi:hypothetical protein
VQQRDAGPAVHGALKDSPAVGLAFDLVIAPGLEGDILNRDQFEPQGAGISPHVVDLLLRCVPQPDVKLANITAAQDAAASRRKLAHGGEVGCGYLQHASL